MTIQDATRTAPKPWILPLADPANTLGDSGGKAANLGVLIRAGLPVPPGFCVTTAAYERIAASSEVHDLLAGMARVEQAGDPRLAELASHLRGLIVASPLPPDLEQAIMQAYDALGPEVPVAVRSSATAEDLPTASFAGQQDTYLGIRGRVALLDAVRRCWASLWNERAVSYRAANRIDPQGVRLGVVVQRMVDAQVAGVLFTANPLTGNRREAVLDASLGLGEAVVSGEVNPDHFVVDRRTGAVLERRLGDKRVAIRQLEGGGTRREEREGADSSACMTDDLIRALVQLGSTVEGVFGAPQDIEFALDGEGTLWLTQARPITTLYPLPSGPIPEDRHVYFSLNVFQGMLQPFTPMGVQGMRLTLASLMAAAGFPFADPVAGPPFLVEAGMRVFGDLTPVLRHPFGRRMLLRVMPHMEARSVPIVEHLLAEDPELKPVPASRATTFRRLAGVMARTRLPFRILGALWNPGKAVARATARLRRPPQPSSGRDPLERVQAILFGIAEGFLVVAPVAIAGAIAWGVAEALLSDLATAEELDTARRALPNNPTTEMDLALWQLAQHAQEDAASVEALDSLEPAELEARFRAGRLPGPLQEGLTRFLEAYGQRGLAEIDLGAPRWADEPAYLFGVIRGYGRMRDPELAPDRVFRRAETEADAMVETLTQRAARGNPLRGRLVRFLLGRMRAMFGLREGHKFILVTGLAQARTHLAQVGRELAGQGALEAAEDIFFLDLREVRLAREGRPVRDLVRQRRADYATELQRRQVPRILLSDGTVPVAGPTPSQDQDGLSGAPASAGTVTGRAHVVLDPRNAGLEAGQILVAPSTDPAWTPLFLSAAGLVMEMGGAMSHGAVVAREYGIPAVVGVPQATERIPDGALIEVDGTSGRVRLLGSEP